MLILHDLVEIDAGDNPIFGDVDVAAMEAQEQIAADRIFGLLPDDIAASLRPIWEEFEAAETPSAQFAKALDRFQPPMLNLASGGGSWTDYNVTQDMIADRVGTKIARGAPGLWEYARNRIKAFLKAPAKNYRIKLPQSLHTVVYSFPTRFRRAKRMPK